MVVAEDDTDDYIATQDRIFDARARSLDNRTAIYGQRVSQLGEELVGLNQEVAAQRQQIALLAEEIESIRVLVKKGFEGKSRLLALQRRKAEVAGKQAQNRARAARVEQRIGETRLAMVEIRNMRTSEVVAELREVEGRMSDLRERVAAARNELSRTQVRAPVSGTVVNLRIFTRGGVVRQGSDVDGSRAHGWRSRHRDTRKADRYRCGVPRPAGTSAPHGILESDHADAFGHRGLRVGRPPHRPTQRQFLLRGPGRTGSRAVLALRISSCNLECRPR